MIEEIRIRDLGVIAEATLPLEPGFTVVTGETGAGKTMVVTAVGLLLGGRADSGAVRLAAKAASAEATVRLPAGHAALHRAEQAGAELEVFQDQAELLLARSVGADGRSKAFIGGRSAPVSVLAELGEQLVVVHGQSDQIRLKSAAAQREALDSFAGPDFAVSLAEYRSLYERWRTAQNELDELRENGRERAREAAELSQALAEIDALDPQPGEDESLKAEAVKLANLESLRQAAGQAHQALIAEDYGDALDASTLVDSARRALDQVAEHDEALRSSAERVTELGYLLADVAAELASYLSSLDSDAPGRLAAIEDRRGELGALTRKYAPSIDEVLSWAEASRARLDELQDDSTKIEELQAEVEALDRQLLVSSDALSTARRAAAEELGQRVTAELAALAMADAALHLEVTEAARGPHGADEIAILLQPHPGAPARPVGKGASGGELSRVMLALEVVLAAIDPVPTFVFDEVDAGVGGKAAVEIGRRLAMLARHVQVLVVTHLPQVAAFADSHIRVLKTSEGGFTSSDVQALDEAERVRELARMLAGQEDSASAQAHAQELLDEARS
ncbi:DNA repair protein RecN (Recombination protein N) [Psychromicrobium silvestre]|uniref:DNA repair protein RecN n=1 Tax=Psychromicrobium silvestre TaxID=1645614 RepID=A0A7Y9LQQ1_9MICC|nr:DNA repair protein RecN (Recombination protein N) [Psychromicrobium silvestre]